MILGMTTATFTLVHVLISLVGLGAGFIVVSGLLRGKRLNGLTAIFLITTVLTSVTGFFFPNDHATPGIKIGVISMGVLVLAIVARYAFHLAGPWARTYVITAMIALYLNTFVAVAQCFAKVPALHALAPTGKEAPFLVAQLVVLVIFIGLTIPAVKKFHPPAEEQIGDRPHRAA